jgi:hypothetical protein
VTRTTSNVPDEPQEDEAPETHQDCHSQRQDTERPHRPGKRPGNAAGSRPEIHVLISNESDDVPEPNEVPHPRRWDDPILVEREDTAGSRELVLVPDRPKRGVYLVNPSDFVNPEVGYGLPEPPRARARMVVSGLVIAFQLAIAALAVAAFYVAMWGRDSAVQIAKETSAVGTPAPGTIAEAAIAEAAIAGGPLAGAPAAAALPFPLPNAYGVYALNDDQLIELEQIQATPVDPRIRSQLQITKPARVVIDATKLAFVVFRRELVSSAPDKVSVRIASRIAHSMIFDSTGKPEVTTPATDTWLIREKGYDLRVSRCARLPRW